MAALRAEYLAWREAEEVDHGIDWLTWDLIDAERPEFSSDSGAFRSDDVRGDKRPIVGD
jgi:hypothetical protein